MEEEIGTGRPAYPNMALVSRMMEDDNRAFDELMKHYYNKLYRIAYLISGNYSDSEDILQETFVLCWFNRKKIRKPEYFEYWLIKTLTREAWRFCRSRKREQPVEEVFSEEMREDSSAADVVIKDSQNLELYQAIKKLPVKQRTVVVLYYFNEMSTKEIANVMGCLDGTVKSRLYTARNNLKNVLSDEQQCFVKEAAL